jgi:hypothetical protein
MTHERKEMEGIENFLLGNLSAQDTETIRVKMQENPDFRQQVFAQKIVMDQLYGRGHKGMQVELDRIHQKYFGKKRRRKILWILFSGLGLIIPAILFILFTPKNEMIMTHEPLKHVIPKNEKNVAAPDTISKKMNAEKPLEFAKIKTEKVKVREKSIPPPPFPESKYSKAAVEDLNRLSYLTDGSIFFANASEISGYINKIISGNLSEGSEIVLLIDKTQSMHDDIRNVKDNVQRILEELKKKNDTRICISFFGDANYNNNQEWFSSSGFTNNYNILEKFLNDNTLVTGVDNPESMYDAICNQLNEIPFSTTKKRIMILITDAAAQKNEFTVNDENYTLRKCKDEKVTIFSIALQPDTK